MAYESPIKIIEGQLKMQMEGNIMRAVQSYDIHVDKNELLRALQYDRGQYEKGFQDGIADATPKWIPVAEQLPETGKIVLAYTGVGYFSDTAQWTGYRWEKTWDFEVLYGVTHWMPLPEPPKEG